jgi:hypothetical protein
MYIKRQKLLTIERYASEQGVSADIVKACIRSGVISVRSHKGKEYVVDIPLSPYFGISETSKNRLEEKEGSATIEAGSISRLAEKMLQKASEIKKMTDEVKK